MYRAPYCIRGYLRSDFTSTNFASHSSQKFPLEYTAIYSNEKITKIAKLSHREFPHLVQNRENICMQNIWRIQYRPYALTSRLHNNDATLGVKTCRAARTCCAGRAPVRGPARASPAVWHAGIGPLAAYLAMAHVAVPRLTPNTRGRPSVTSYAYGLLQRHDQS